MTTHPLDTGYYVAPLAVTDWQENEDGAWFWSARRDFAERHEAWVRVAPLFDEWLVWVTLKGWLTVEESGPTRFGNVGEAKAWGETEARRWIEADGEREREEWRTPEQG